MFEFFAHICDVICASSNADLCKQKVLNIWGNKPYSRHISVLPESTPPSFCIFFFFVLSRRVSYFRKAWWTWILQEIINLSQFFYSRWNASFCSGLMFYSIRLSLRISQPSFSMDSKKPKINVRKVTLPFICSFWNVVELIKVISNLENYSIHHSI